MHNVLLTTAAEVFCPILMGQKQLKWQNVISFSFFKLWIQKACDGKFYQFLMDIPSFRCAICWYSWIKSCLPPFFIWWQYIATAATHTLPLLFLFQNLEIWENALTVADIRVVSLVQNEAKDQILQIEYGDR